MDYKYEHTQEMITMTRSMRRRFKKIVLASTLAMLGAWSGSGWLIQPALGQEASSPEKTKKSPIVRDTRIVLGATGTGVIMAWKTTDSLVRFYTHVNKLIEAAYKDKNANLDEIPRITKEMVDSGEMRYVKCDTPAIVREAIPISNNDFVYWVIIGDDVAPWIVRSGSISSVGPAPVETVVSLKRKMVKVAGETYRVDGDDYYIVNIMNNQSTCIHSSPERPMPPRFHQMNGPNSFFIDALFKFVRNVPGTNGYGASINIELYEPYTDSEILKIAPNSWQGAAARSKVTQK